MEIINNSSQFKIINSFKQINFEQNKPLVICDIDYTILKCSIKLERFYKLVKEEYESIKLEENDINRLVIEWRDTAYDYGYITQTDSEGFNELINIIESLGGKIIFLTARGINYHKETIEQLNYVGINKPEEYEIHYTNSKISKGLYIKQSNLINGYKDIYFIDDKSYNISSVLDLYPQIKCYLFCYEE